MLYEPDRHEPLSETPWNEVAAGACIRAILRDAVECFSPDGLWPAHPLDGVLDGIRRDLYLGSAGTVLALNQLASRPAFAEFRVPLNEINRTWLAHDEANSEPGLLTMGTGTLLLRAMLAGIESAAGELAIHIDENSGNPVLEFMWGSPGTMTAAVWLHEKTGEGIWAERFRRDADLLWDQLDYVEEAGCHLWVQHLYGHVAPFIGAVHGFAGNAFALLRGWPRLSPDEQTRWAERLSRAVRATARREGDCANWPQSIGRHRPDRTAWLVQHCHGAPGIVTCLAGFPDSSIDDLLTAGGELAWRAGPLTKGSNLCHGTAGNGFAFLKLYRRTGEEHWLDRARRFAMHAIEQQQRDNIAYGQNRYPLWTGDPGLAIYLAHCIAGTDSFPTMDEFFAG